MRWSGYAGVAVTAMKKAFTQCNLTFSSQVSDGSSRELELAESRGLGRENEEIILSLMALIFFFFYILLSNSNIIRIKNYICSEDNFIIFLLENKFIIASTAAQPYKTVNYYFEGAFQE